VYQVRHRPRSVAQNSLLNYPTWQDKPINLAVASHPIFWAKTAPSHPRLL
jgi:hypothetical protein